jgi:hypothetical protein
MKTQEMFVSVDEKALETVSGGLLDLLNKSLNGNTINILSGINLEACIGDVLSTIGNLANEVAL